MGQRTSVYLSDEIAAAVKASGVSLAELVSRGLGAERPDGGLSSASVTAHMRNVRGSAGKTADCPHRGLAPGAWCKTCQSEVPERRKSGG